MAFERWTAKKVYYYIICAVTLLVLMWGTVDVLSSVLSLTIFKGPSLTMDIPGGPQSAAMATEGKGGNADQPMFDEYYQSRMVFDRMGDSIARILVAGVLFLYAGSRVRELEGKEI
jgi:hypothetical protein